MDITSKSEAVRIVFDQARMQVGCVLIQATCGAPPHVASAFDARDWFLAPTATMEGFTVAPDQLPRLIEACAEHRDKPRHPDGTLVEPFRIFKNPGAPLGARVRGTSQIP